MFGLYFARLNPRAIQLLLIARSVPSFAQFDDDHRESNCWILDYVQLAHDVEENNSQSSGHDDVLLDAVAEEAEGGRE